MKIYDIPVNRIDGQSTTLSDYKGKVLLIVNTASKCGLTPQYEGLEKIYEKYKAQGLEVLGFPANEFLGQEPGSNAEISQFCEMKFGIKFPLFEKIVVKGEGQHPLYKFLTESKPQATKNPEGNLEKKLTDIGQAPKKPNDILWNFEKFIIGRDGQIVDRFAPDVAPENPLLVQSIEKSLKA